MRPEEEIMMLRKRQSEAVRKKSLRKKYQEALLSGCGVLFGIGVVYGLYHALELMVVK